MSVASTNFPDAATHSYLGDGQASNDSRQYLHPGSQYEILIYPTPELVLFPGQTIPLRIQSAEFVRRFFLMRSGSASGQQVSKQLSNHIGIVNVAQNRLQGYGTLSRIGTTMEVRSTHDRTFSDQELVVSGKGRHRFRVLSIKNESGVPLATVEILDDGIPQFAPISMKLSPFPGWIYELYSPQRLARVAYSLFESTTLWTGENNVLSRWGCTRYLHRSSIWSCERRRFCDSQAEEDPVAFAYFLSASMAVEPARLQALLETVGVVERLRLLIEMLREGLHRKIACRVCAAPLANKGELFSVDGAEGVSGMYVNRHGALHQTLTVRSLLSDESVYLRGQPSTQDSWFPGYAWTIIHCGRCMNHLGWKFTWAGNATMNEGSDSDSSTRYEDTDDEEEDYESMETVDDDEHNDDDNNSEVDAEAKSAGENDNAVPDFPDVASNSDNESQAEGSNSPPVHSFWGLTRSSIKEV